MSTEEYPERGYTGVSQACTLTFAPFSFSLSFFPSILSLKTRNLSAKKIIKRIQKKSQGWRPAAPPYKAALLPPIQVGAKCLAAAVLDDHNRVIHE